LAHDPTVASFPLSAGLPLITDVQIKMANCLKQGKNIAKGNTIETKVRDIAHHYGIAQNFLSSDINGVVVYHY
jgi:hypothetical protein